MASNDLKRWQDAIAMALPDATGTVVVDGVTAMASRYTITVNWAQPGEADTPATYTNGDI